MLVASRPYALAAAALAAVSTVVVTPILVRQVPLAVRSMETKLVDVDGSLANIGVNLFDDILNIPYNEVVGGGLGTVGDSFLFTGTWWVPSSTNLWGIDPGDPTHVALIDNFLPFEAFTQGFTNSAGDYEPGLNYELAGLLAAEIPISATCDAATCAPITPPEVITGSTGLDRDIGFIDSLFGKAPDGASQLFSNWFQVPLSELIKGYTFGTSEPGDPGVVDPSGPVTPGFGFGGLDGSGNPFEGGTGPGDTVPWDGTDYHLNLFQPLVTFIDSLEQTPTGVDALTFAGIDHSFENLLAGFIIDFDPYTAGSPACPGECVIGQGDGTSITESNSIPALIADIAKMDPSNQTLATWVTDYAADPTSVNEPSQVDINAAIALLQTGSYNFSPEGLAQIDGALANINPELPVLLTNAGFLTDPDYLTYATDLTNGTDPSAIIERTTGFLDTVYGGYNPSLDFTDFMTLLKDAQVDPTFSADINTVLTDLTFPGHAGDLVVESGTAAASAAASAAADPSWAADWSTLMASFGTTAGADTFSALMTDISAQLTADLAAWVPQSLLSMF